MRRATWVLLGVVATGIAVAAAVAAVLDVFAYPAPPPDSNPPRHDFVDGRYAVAYATLAALASAAAVTCFSLAAIPGRHEG